MSSTLPDAPQRIQIGRRNAAILAGKIDLSDWDDEELQRGQKRSRRGTWEGRPPKVVPKQLHDELVRRKLNQANAMMRDHLVEAVQMFYDLMTAKDTEDAIRFKCAMAIKDHVMGKAPERIQVQVEVSPFEASMGSVFRKRTVIETSAEEGDAA